MGKAEGEAAGRHCDDSSSISMWFVNLLLIPLFVLLFVFFFFSIEGINLNTDGISYY